MLKVFIGYDPREAVAYHALVQSIVETSSMPVSITPLALQHLEAVLTRPRDPLQSTDFAFSRFLVPYLCDYKGWAIFMDCDMIVTRDLAAIWELKDDSFAVQVVKHAHKPAESHKFLGQPQTRYEKKNWSSVMLFNNARCTALTPDYVNQASGLELHQFKWLAHDGEIGSLPPGCNHLVGYDEHSEMISVLHYTTGGPYFEKYRDTEYADIWFDVWSRAAYAQQQNQPDGGPHENYEGQKHEDRKLRA
ncbi:MAG: glycosyltransferase [Gammaproteobacteria bacterium]|nr:glycosyltransferase [Gammaproteobacteria bacterium]